MTDRTNIPTILPPAYLPHRMTKLAAAVRAAVLERIGAQLLHKCRGDLRRLPINEASTVQDYMHARMQSGAV